MPVQCKCASARSSAQLTVTVGGSPDRLESKARCYASCIAGMQAHSFSDAVLLDLSGRAVRLGIDG